MGQYRYIVTVKQDCSIRWREATRVVEVGTLDPTKAIAKALKQIIAETEYDLWQSDEVVVTCKRTP